MINQVKPPAQARVARKTQSNKVPNTIKGRRLPQREIQPSDRAPESGWMNIANSSPTKVSRPK